MSNLVDGVVPIPAVPLELNNNGDAVNVDNPVVYVDVPVVPPVNVRPSVTTNTLLLLFMFFVFVHP